MSQAQLSTSLSRSMTDAATSTQGWRWREGSITMILECTGEAILITEREGGAGDAAPWRRASSSRGDAGEEAMAIGQRRDATEGAICPCVRHGPALCACVGMDIHGMPNGSTCDLIGSLAGPNFAEAHTHPTGSVNRERCTEAAKTGLLDISSGLATRWVTSTVCWRQWCALNMVLASIDKDVDCLFMALQPRMIACGNSVATFAMAVRFLTGPAVMAAASIAVGLRGVLLRVAIVQGHLWNADSAAHRPHLLHTAGPLSGTRIPGR
ncbi:hypothetical protein Taro_028676 [Colocasia esculenta]|uniref:Uncharacterized protein n=1 Tax=Colocasia esculenta TaxID=4460 RepID=A0A843VLS3_COLES|nr:hypothetical protein [Colocasia esculenta]